MPRSEKRIGRRRKNWERKKQAEKRAKATPTTENKEPWEATATEATMDTHSDPAVPLPMVSNQSNQPFFPHCNSGQHYNYEFSDRDLPIHQGSTTVVFGEKEHQNALPTIASTNKPVMIAATNTLPNEEANLMSIGCKATRKNRKRNGAFLKTHTSHGGDELCMGGNSGVGSKCARTMASYNRNESLVAGAGSGLGCGYAAGDGKDHHPSYSNSNQLVGYEVMPNRKGNDRNATAMVAPQELSSKPDFHQFAKGHNEPHFHSQNPLNDAEKEVHVDLTVSPPNSTMQLQVNAVAASGMDMLDAILNKEDLLDEDSEIVALDGISPSIPLIDEETEQSMLADMTNDPDATYADVLADVLRPDDEAINEEFPVASVSSKLAAGVDTLALSPSSSHHPEPAKPPTVQVNESMSINPQRQFDVAPTSQGASCFITGSFNRCRTPPLMSPQETWVGITTTCTNSIPPTHMGHIPRPKLYTSIVPPLAPSSVDLTHQTTPQPKGYFSSNLCITGKKKVFEFKMLPNLSSERQDFAIAALMYVARFYSDVFLCSLRRDLDLKIATNVHARMCDYTNEAHCLKQSMPRNCLPLSDWLKVNPDLKCRLLVLQQVINTVTIIHSQKLSLWGSFWVWVAIGLEAYMLVDFSTVLRKRRAAITENSCHTRKMDVMAMKEIYNEIVSSHSSSLCSPELRRALSLFEHLLNDPQSYCRLAEGARILGEKRVCRIDVDIDFGQKTVLYCLEGEKLSIALKDISKMVPPHADYVWTVHSVPRKEHVLINDTAIADPQMHLVLKPSSCSHFCDPHCQLLLIRYAVD